MKVLKILGVLLGIVLLIAIVLYIIGPDKVYMERSIVVDTPIKKVYSDLNNLKNHTNWWSWGEKDPHMKRTYTGPESGLGSKVEWESDSASVGSGAMWIVEVEENKMIKNQMQLPFPGEQYARFKLSKTARGTEIIWTYEEDPEMMARMMYALANVESFLAPDYEKGLENFKKYIEDKYNSSSSEISVVDAEPIYYLGINAVITQPTSEKISNKMSQSYGKLINHIQANNIKMTGMPLAIYTNMSEEELGFICGIPVNDGTTISKDSIESGTIGGGKMVKAIHKGDYVNLPSTYEIINTYIGENQLAMTGNPYEIYVTDPGEEIDTTQWVTHVFYPVSDN